jgi:uncharacterized coiled-coil DUF342 family protein
MSLNAKAVEFVPESKSSFEAYIHNTFNEMKNKIKLLEQSVQKLETYIDKMDFKNKLINHDDKLDAIHKRIEEIEPKCEKCNGYGEYVHKYIGECGNDVKDYRECSCLKSKKEFDKVMNDESESDSY